ncbi:hypothetical protein [Novosphingobium resinovorum]|uniref:hypothetical protein n=1 Tax=Novosphingobium resinovorum TaxID=158500 RepID=UPI002ED600EA|nr:hypothetical protein [Novosphingobium resinovorum]
MTIGGGNEAGSAAQDWKAVRDAADIQYTPLPKIKPQPPTDIPEWLKALGRLLEAIFAPIGKLLGMSWPVFQWILIGGAVLLGAFILWRLLLEPGLEAWRGRRPKAEQVHWTPNRAEAVALLEDADRLAAAGRYGEAAHLLLQRSVRQISDARPDWLNPASTAREIAVLPLLPETGRSAFAVIAQRVERAYFALRDLDAGDWTAARTAYAQFAQIELRA